MIKKKFIVDRSLVSIYKKEPPDGLGDIAIKESIIQPEVPEVLGRPHDFDDTPLDIQKIRDDIASLDAKLDSVKQLRQDVSDEMKELYAQIKAGEITRDEFDRKAHGVDMRKRDLVTQRESLLLSKSMLAKKLESMDNVKKQEDIRKE